MNPISIAHRMPTPSDRNTDGLCWFGEYLGQGRSCWFLINKPDAADTHWLPAAALPTVPDLDAEI